jgi:ligand-binding sensor domain-containing protein
MIFFNRIYSYLLIFFLLNIIIFPQYRSLRFENISINEGLSNNSINCILQTKDGFLWIATKDGLNRYDGQNFKIYKNNPSLKNSLPENYVMSLLESSDGTFWVGTWGGGLCKYDPLHEAFLRYDLKTTEDDYIESLYEDTFGNIWYGTMHYGLSKINSVSHIITTYNPYLSGNKYFPDNEITCIKADEKNFLWIGTLRSGLIKFDPLTETFKQFKHQTEIPNSISGNYVWDVLVDNDKLFLSTESGLDIFDLKTEKVIKYPSFPIANDDSPFKTFRQAMKDHLGNIWAGTYNYLGLFIFPDDGNYNKFIHLEGKEGEINSIISSRIRWLYEDRSKNIWVGTEEGISKLTSTKAFLQYRLLPLQKNTLGGKVVSSIIADKDSIIWVGYGGGGFDKIDIGTNEIIHYKNIPYNNNSLSVNDVVCMHKDKNGILWIGTSYGGLNRFDPETGKFKVYRNIKSDNSSLKSDWVQQILETSDGKFLVGTNDGLQLFDRRTEKFFDYQPENVNDKVKLPRIFSVNSLFQDRSGDIWIGTWLDGLFRYESKKQFLHHYKPIAGDIKSLSASKVSFITEDSKGNIWIGTHSGGFNKFDKAAQTFTRFTTRDGLPNDVVFGILEDESGFLWISTMKGLTKFDPEKKSFRVYDQADGIIHNQFNWHASYKDKYGKMYFGGNNGFILFDPKTILIDTVQSQIALTSFKVFDKEATLPQSLPTIKEVTLNYNQNFFSIEFAALDMAPAHKHTYSYKLEGIDPDWINSDFRTTAYYTDIDPGEYKFLVKASNADKIWSDPIALSIIIKPAWWMTWWFKLIIVLAITFTGFLLYRFRVNQLLKIERIRYDIASDLHDEIGSNLSSISVDGQLLQKSDSLTEKERELSFDISKTAAQTLDAMRDIIWFINPKNDESEDITFKMKETASRLLGGIEWSFNASGNIRFEYFSLEQRRNIFLIYKEALTNVIRHSKAKKCSVNLVNNSDNLTINVKDNGDGFDFEKVRKNTGILSMLKRAEKIKGNLTFESKPGEGTSVILVISNKSNIKQKLQMP